MSIYFLKKNIIFWGIYLIIKKMDLVYNIFLKIMLDMSVNFLMEKLQNRVDRPVFFRITRYSTSTPQKADVFYDRISSFLRCGSVRSILQTI